jgi:hypothetical protein
LAFWEAPAAIGQRRAAEVLVEVAADARELNNAKGRWLTRAMTLEVVAVAVLGIAVVLILAAGGIRGEFIYQTRVVLRMMEATTGLKPV